MPMPVSRTSKREDGVGRRFADARDGDDDFALGGEFDGVADEVVDDLAQAAGVAAQFERDFGADEGGELEALAVGLGGEEVHGAVDDLAQVEVGDVEVELAGLDLGEVEDVVDDDEERFAADADGAGELALLVRQVGHEQEVGHADDAVHRRADFVAHVGEEFALEPVGRLGRDHGGLERDVGALALGDVLAEDGDAADARRWCGSGCRKFRSSAPPPRTGSGAR